MCDPNVLVSAFISQRGGAPDRIVRAWREGAFELVVSPGLIAELTDVLARPRFARQAAEGRAEAYVAALAGDATQIDDPPDPPSLSPDPSDDYLIALARVAHADVDRLRRSRSHATRQRNTSRADAAAVRPAADLSAAAKGSDGAQD